MFVYLLRDQVNTKIKDHTKTGVIKSESLCLMDTVDTVTRVVFVSFVYALAFGTFPGPAPAIHIGPPWSKSGLLLTCTCKH